MNYESFYTAYQSNEKEMRDLLTTQQKLFKRLTKSMEKGDLKSANKDYAALSTALGEALAKAATARGGLEDFDTNAYLQSGAYASQLMELCEREGIDIKGEGNVFEVFPYKVKIDAENGDVYIDRKRLPYMRPAAFVKELKTGRDKLMSAPFNAGQFASELSEVYDLAVKSGGKKTMAPDADLYLKALYNYLTPMRRFRKDYDMQSYAFDLARLYTSGFDTLADGRKLQFGPSRQNAKAIRILDAEGGEQYLATIRFYRDRP